jgi:hypothetical protein
LLSDALTGTVCIQVIEIVKVIEPQPVDAGRPPGGCGYILLNV